MRQLVAPTLLDTVCLHISRLFIAGLSPIAPGTCGSALAALVAPWLFLPLSMSARVIVLVLVFIFGSLISTRVERMLGVKDPGEAVIDELLGIWLVLLPFKEPSWLFIGVAFVLFRFFDILKPWPVRASENWLPEGWGIMIDDVLAGLQALLVIAVLQYFGILL
jgi:phosphatidylglycerophosphatase A